MMRNALFTFIALFFLLSACNESSQQKAAAQLPMETKTTQFYPELQSYIQAVLPDTASIATERKEALDKLATYIRKKQDAGNTASLTFICTHNSRRSHLSQIWAATAAAYYGLGEHVQTFSGGTEATAFNPRAVAAIERAGFTVENPGGENPHYQVRLAEQAPAMECFSKTYDDPFANPQKEFAAVMTCSDADENCPIVPGAEFRQAIPYEDPKVADGTPEETARYDERCRQIATEMFYMMSRV